MSQNTKHVLTRRYWLVTWNNPGPDWQACLRNTGCQWYVGQLEQGENGTPHIQALLWFRDRTPNSFWKGYPCWSKAVYSDEIDKTIAYVTKEETRIDGPCRYGKMPNHAKSSPTARRNVRDWNLALTCAKEGRIKDVEASILIPHVQNLQRISHLFQESVGTNRPRGLWIQGKPGVGKSYYARQCYPKAFIKAQNKWWDGYSGEDSVILDDLDKLGTCLGHYLKIWLDEYPFDGEIKGGHVATRYTLFVITSNYWPSELFEDPVLAEAISRRCRFIRFTGFCQYDVGADLGVIPPLPEEQYFYPFGSF